MQPRLANCLAAAFAACILLLAPALARLTWCRTSSGEWKIKA
jgi:hypothetical protein